MTDPIDAESKRPVKRLTRAQWETAVDQAIREAIERGDFDHLPGAGKPLTLKRDPNVPEEWELAIKLLKDAGYAADWIELDKEIRTAREKLFLPVSRYLKRRPPGAGLRAAQEAQLIESFRVRAGELNRQIDVFNLKAPTPLVHRPRIRIEAEIEKFREACEKT